MMRIYHFLTILSLVTLIFPSCDPPVVTTPIPEEAVTISEDIEADRTLEDIIDDPNLPDYCFTSEVNVSNAVLTIAPGVVIEFATNASLIIDEDAAIVARGTAAEPITFTGKTKSKGSWKGISIFSGDIRNEITNSKISYAGQSAVSSIWRNIKAGIVLHASSIWQGKLTLEDTEFSNIDGYGLVLDEATDLVSFARNAFKNNTLAGIYTGMNNVGKFDAATELSGGNGYDGVEIYESELTTSFDQIWAGFDDGSRYKVLDDIVIESGLTLLPGVYIEFDPATRMKLDDESGSFISAKGTASNKITFTGSVQSGPSWKGIVIFSSDIRNEFSHCEISYGGSAPVDGPWAPGVKSNITLLHTSAFSGVLNLNNSTVNNSGGCGVTFQTGTTLTETDNIYSSNVMGNVCN